MTFRIREHQQRRQQELEKTQNEMILQEVRRYSRLKEGQSIEDAEQAIIYKVKAMRSHMKSNSEAIAATAAIVRSIKDNPIKTQLPISQIEPSLLLELL